MIRICFMKTISPLTSDEIILGLVRLKERVDKTLPPSKSIEINDLVEDGTVAKKYMKVLQDLSAESIQYHLQK